MTNKSNYSRKCDLPPKKRKDANIIEVYSDLDSEDKEENYEEVYATSRIKITSYTTNRRETKEKSKMMFKFQQKIRLRYRNISKSISLTTLMNIEEGNLTPKSRIHTSLDI
ncbi:13718_t:CDS:2 [Funneliformis mosseae]|uniref:13718_t:CDS:1 n=1 Tax=Funneliformis mosseae TaxID=27381 RepID=A0A9N9D9D6_FUNMO|nr:13718_t:CDS:2 [Funneliformis mosseae]